MKDINICLKQRDGTELNCSTVHIEEDVLRMRCGLDLKGDNNNAEGSLKSTSESGVKILITL